MTGDAHRTTLRVRFYELDPYGHVNHSVYIQYFESARVELLDSIGFGLDTMQADGIQLVVIRIATRFITAATLSQELVVETGLVDAGRVKSRWAQRITVDNGQQTVATQLIDFATTNAAGRPRRAPEGLGDAMHRFAVPADWLGSDSPE